MGNIVENTFFRFLSSEEETKLEVELEQLNICLTFTLRNFAKKFPFHFRHYPKQRITQCYIPLFNGNGLHLMVS